MHIPSIDLRPALEETRSQWPARLDEVFARMNFILGGQGAAFEREFAAAMGGRRAAGCGNGTAAIDVPVTERTCRRLLPLPRGSHLPLWSHLPPEQAAEAAGAMRAFYR